jgi:putative hydrolase of the HAD superfamily
MKRGAPVWIFDLDNTLHDARPHIFPHINRSMTAYLAAHLGLDEAQASALRASYWRRYGATLLGMMRHHGTDPHHFLRETHRFPDIAPMVVSEPQLSAVLRRLPGRKLVFSNAPLHYVEAVLAVMGVRAFFDEVYTIEQMRFRPKPSERALRRLLREKRLRPSRCIMVEDTAANLKSARRLGLATVWVSRETRCPAWVDLRIQSVRTLPRCLGRLSR